MKREQDKALKSNKDNGSYIINNQQNMYIK